MSMSVRTWYHLAIIRPGSMTVIVIRVRLPYPCGRDYVSWRARACAFGRGRGTNDFYYLEMNDPHRGRVRRLGTEAKGSRAGSAPGMRRPTMPLRAS